MNSHANAAALMLDGNKIYYTRYVRSLDAHAAIKES